MTNIVKEHDGVVEGYGHGKGCNIQDGDELALDQKKKVKK
jgi:hypothetical protein